MQSATATAARPQQSQPARPHREAVPIAPTSDDLAANTAGAKGFISTAGTVRSLRPLSRPRAILQEAMAQRRERRRGAVCGNLAIQGSRVGAVSGAGACGIRRAVRLRSVSGVALSQQALVDCGTAKALNRWVANAVKPAIGPQGGGVVQLRVAAHYACRSRNNQSGAKLSEHGKGRAIDISAFILRDGSSLTVLDDWRSVNGPILRGIHRRACGIFGTVLGPESDRFHQDHFHLDTARYRAGSYCR